MTAYEAALELIREGDTCRLLARVGRDTATDHRALNEARARYDETREAQWNT